MTEEEIPTHTLIVDKSPDSQEAIKLCQAKITRLEIRDVSGKEPDSVLLPRPRLLGPHGRCLHLHEIKEYMAEYTEESLKQGIIDPRERHVSTQSRWGAGIR